MAAITRLTPGCIASAAPAATQTISMDIRALFADRTPKSIAPAKTMMAMKSANKTQATNDGPRAANSAAKPKA